jgi:alpha-D-ribose 1-methylphosphonate 5-triphosphate synthase subunit PhnH
MKKFTITVIIMCATFFASAQLQTIVLDKHDEISSNTLVENGTLIVKLTATELQLELDWDGTGTAHNLIVATYKLSGTATLLWNEAESGYNTLFDFSVGNDHAIGGLISPVTNSIMLFYADKSSLMYLGTGLQLLI